MMQAKPELRNFDSVLTAIKRARTPFEQYHALLLGRVPWIFVAGSCRSVRCLIS
jgi:hypothetical protein